MAPQRPCQLGSLPLSSGAFEGANTLSSPARLSYSPVPPSPRASPGCAQQAQGSVQGIRELSSAAWMGAGVTSETGGWFFGVCFLSSFSSTTSTRQRMSGVVQIEAVSPYKATCSGGSPGLGQSWSGRMRKSHQLLPAPLSSVPLQGHPRSHPGFLLGRVPRGSHYRDMAGRRCGV